MTLTLTLTLTKVYVLGPFGAACAVAEERRAAVVHVPSDLNPFTPDLREMEEVGAVGGRPQATLLIVAGSGITPIAALLEAHLRRRSASSAKTLPALTLVWTVSRGGRLHLACTSPAPVSPLHRSLLRIAYASRAPPPHLRRTSAAPLPPPSPHLSRCVTSTSS